MEPTANRGNKTKNPTMTVISAHLKKFFPILEWLTINNSNASKLVTIHQKIFIQLPNTPKTIDIMNAPENRMKETKYNFEVFLALWLF